MLNYRLKMLHVPTNKLYVFHPTFNFGLETMPQLFDFVDKWENDGTFIIEAEPFDFNELMGVAR